MPLDVARTRQLLKNFDFDTLFIQELGWDHHDQHIDITVDGETYALAAIAEKRGMVAFEHTTRSRLSLPDYQTRRKIERQLTKAVHEHLIIFVDKDRTTQIWQWVKREQGKPTACREQAYYSDQTGEALIQKLQHLVFTLEDEEKLLTVVDVSGRARAAFDVDRVTKHFYDRFKAEQVVFHEFISGIPDDEMQQWYVCVTLNRLMFVYFIQKKGFLDNDIDYLRNKLEESKRKGKDRYYKHFLCPLFFEGFAKKDHERSKATNKLLGQIPYLNGGIFQKHEIETRYGETIEIPDKAFEEIFEFFDAYQWHLDERPLRADNEINPDVLGYIFEKYINQKQMGAYYTKEDITEYISKNTVIPFLFDSAKKKCRIAFEGEQSIWQLLKTDPDRYIYEAVKTGVKLPLPEEIAEGLSDISKRTKWNKPAAPEYALPTEIWREVVARRKRHEEVYNKLESGDIRDINDFITYNLNIRQFAQDVIENCEGPELLRAFWHAIESVTILDPTCGSGAFLFAALNILELLYEACVERMEAFVEELDRSGEKHHPEKFSDFRKVLERTQAHPNRHYFIFKSIILNNLFGVDIMDEAVEICKLRFFLKLAAQIEPDTKRDNLGIEPLPDIDFNIRAGNTLVGYATRAELEASAQNDWILQGQIGEVIDAAEDVATLYQRFLECQVEGDESPAQFKGRLNQKFRYVRDKCDGFLAEIYEMGKSRNRKKFAVWKRAYKPFHWFVEFFGTVNSGGFDVIIGNPPYVEYKAVSSAYTVRNFTTEACGNLYSYIIERSFKLARNRARVGLIVPISITAAQRMATLQEFVVSRSDLLVLSNFGLRPAALFPGIMQRLTILLSLKGDRGSVHTSDYTTWYAKERDLLFAQLHFFPVGAIRQPYSIPKANNGLAHSALAKILAKPRPWVHHRQFKGRHRIFYHNAGGYWIKTFNFRPYYKSLKDPSKNHTTISELCLPSSDLTDTYLGILNSTLFYFFWKSLTDARHVYPSDIAMLPIELPLKEPDLEAVRQLGFELMAVLKKNRKRIVYGNAEIDQFYVAPAKHILDEIDRVLARHYGFTKEELDFIINYDIKYRMGQENQE